MTKNFFPAARKAFAEWLRSAALFPFLFPVFFVLHVARYYEGALPLTDVLKAGFCYLLLAIGLALLLSRMFRSRLAWSLTAFFLLVLWIYWQNIVQFIIGLFRLSGNYAYDAGIAFGSVVMAMLLGFFSRKLPSKVAGALLRYLNVLFLVFILVELALISKDALAGRSESPTMLQDARDRQATMQAKPGGSIYLLLFDEYASTPSLKEDWGIDNAAQDSFLKARGFFVNEDSRSNYRSTVFSMASLLHMNYFSAYTKPVSHCDERGVQQAMAAIRDAPVPRLLRRMGYRLRIHSIFDVDDQRGHAVPNLVMTKRPLTGTSFYYAWQNGYLPYLRERSLIKKNPHYRYSVFYKMDDYNNEGVSMVMQQAQGRHDTPAFVYAHFMMPHNRYYYDSADRLLPMDTIKAINSAQDLRFYGYAIRHANGKMRAMVDAIQHHDPGACIIVLGDHGYRRHQDGRLHPEYFRNLCAVYYPDRDYSRMPHAFTNVNLLRLVLNKMCGSSYPLIPERCYDIETIIR